MSLKEKVHSRKFWMALVGGLLPLLAHYVDGSVTLEQAMQAGTAVAVAYLFGQGYADGQSNKSPPVQVMTNTNEK